MQKRFPMYSSFIFIFIFCIYMQSFCVNEVSHLCVKVFIVNILFIYKSEKAFTFSSSSSHVLSDQVVFTIFLCSLTFNRPCLHNTANIIFPLHMGGVTGLRVAQENNFSVFSVDTHTCVFVRHT